MEELAFLSPLLLVITGLILGSILKGILRSTRIPYTVALFGVGIAIGLMNLNGVFNFSTPISKAIDSVASINPDIIVYIFLPILVFDASYELNLHVFKKTLANATLLAAPGLVICMFLTGLLMVGIGKIVPGFEAWTWSFALMFGALISATDPVAVVSLLHELKTSKRFSTLVDAESLLNDGTGIVCFMVFFGVYAQTGSLGSPLVEFMRVISVSSLIGYIAARLVIAFITYIHRDDQIQNSAIILTSYGIFILTQYYLGVSGIITLVVFGLTFTYLGKPRLKPEVNAFMGMFWDLLNYIANTLIFLLVGIVIAEKVSFNWTTLGVAILVYVILNVIRYAMIRLLYPAMKRLGYGLTPNESVILAWGGLRGALAMALALIVSYTPAIPEIIRSQILLFTATVVTLTLLINATTMRWLLNKLGLIHNSSARAQMEYHIQETLRANTEEYLRQLKEREHLKGSNWTLVERFVMHASEIPFKEPKQKAVLHDIRLHILDYEKRNIKKMFDEGVLSRPAFLRLINSLDELYDHDGTLPLNYRKSIESFCQRVQILNTLRKLPYIHKWMENYFRERICIIYDLGRGFLLLQQENLAYLQQLKESELVKGHEDILSSIEQEIQTNVHATEEILKHLAIDFPRAYQNALTMKAIRMLLNHERLEILKMIDSGVLSEKDAAPLLENVSDRAAKINLINHSVLRAILRTK